MNAGLISKLVVTDRLGWIDRMLAGIRALPLGDREAFFADDRNLATAESYLRRALEALFDLGRHLLAKGFAVGVSEYKEIAAAMTTHGILASSEADLLRTLAGYRNRLVHYYHEVGSLELYEVCVKHLGDLERITIALREWLTDNPDRLDEAF
jgi:uncharacterized protein YutE (UPF0331/DUF86 family)